MTKARIQLITAGIGALLMLTSFSIWTTIRDRGGVDETLNSFHNDKLASHEVIHDFIRITERSENISISWVYRAGNEQRVKELSEIQRIIYPELKTRIDSLMPFWSAEQRNVVTMACDEFENLIRFQQEGFMLQLQTPADFEDPLKKVQSEVNLEDKILPLAEQIIIRLGPVEKELNNEAAKSYDDLLSLIQVSGIRALIVSTTIFAAGVIGLVIVLGARRKQKPE